MYHFVTITGVTVRKCSIRVKIVDYFVACDLEIWRMTLKNNRTLLLCYFKLCAPLHSHQWIKTRVTVRRRRKIGDFFVPSDLEIWWMTLKNNRAPLLWYVKLCHHFIAISEFKLELPSGNAQIGWNSAIFCRAWPWNLTDDLEKKIGHLFYATSNFVYHFITIGEFKLELQSENTQFGSKLAIFVPCDLEISQMTLKNNRVPLLCHIKFWASFHRHMWIQTGVIVHNLNQCWSIPRIQYTSAWCGTWGWWVNSPALQNQCVVSLIMLRHNILNFELDVYSGLNTNLWHMLWHTARIYKSLVVLRKYSMLIFVKIRILLSPTSHVDIWNFTIKILYHIKSPK